MSRRLSWLIDLLVIVVQISVNMTIIPYYLYADFEPFILVILSNAVLMLGIMFIRFRGKIYPIKNVLSYYPIRFFFLLISLQLVAGIVKMDFNYIGAPVIFGFNFFIFLIYLNNLYEFNLRRFKSPDIAFFKSNSVYMSFALFNVVLVLVSAGLQITGVLAPFSNSINHLYPQLLGSNVEFGGAFYYMPGGLSLQLLDSRLGFFMGTLSGLTHEPHVFGYLVFPALFLFLSRYADKKVMFYLLITAFTIAGVLAFSVTTVLVIAVIIMIKFIADKSYVQVIFVVLSLMIYSVISFDIEILNLIEKYTINKLSVNTGSVDYSYGKIESILYPKTVFGDGVMLLGDEKEKSGGLFTSIAYILFYVSVFFNIFKNIFSTNKRNILIGLAFLYFILHGFKLSSSVFAMPYTVYFLIIMAIYHKYVQPAENKLEMDKTHV